MMRQQKTKQTKTKKKNKKNETNFFGDFASIFFGALKNGKFESN
jgi:hypothetical protein